MGSTAQKYGNRALRRNGSVLADDKFSGGRIVTVRVTGWSKFNFRARTVNDGIVLSEEVPAQNNVMGTRRKHDKFDYVQEALDGDTSCARRQCLNVVRARSTQREATQRRHHFSERPTKICTNH